MNKNTDGRCLLLRKVIYGNEGSHVFQHQSLSGVRRSRIQCTLPRPREFVGNVENSVEISAFLMCSHKVLDCLCCRCFQQRAAVERSIVKMKDNIVDGGIIELL